jgi:hypothetical protein
MFDDFLGRWFTQDPLQEKFYGWSSYVFCMNNPINVIDIDGRFGIKIHKEMLQSALVGTNFSESAQKSMLRGTGVRADVWNMFNSKIHLDSRTNFNAVANGYNNATSNFESSIRAGEYSDAGMTLHTVGDFYSHSNYIDLYMEYAEDAGIDIDVNNIPTFDEAISIPEFKTILEQGLKTGVYKDPFTDKFTNNKDSHKKMNLDSNKTEQGKKSFGDTSATKHDAARSVAEKDITNRVQKINQEIDDELTN